MQLIKRIMTILVSIILLFAIVVFFYVRLPQFGKAPDEKRREQLLKSPHYVNGQFRNIHPAPNFTGGSSPGKIFFRFLFGKSPRARPVDDIPSVKTDLKNLPGHENVLVWFGHSSYFIQLNGKRFLIDPVFSNNASPVPNSNRSFRGTDLYSADDMPEIDYLLITHDHYDHLDYPTVKKLKHKIKHIVCGLGVGTHFEHWKFDSKKIIEKDWNESMPISESFTLHTVPTHHFSGRSFSRNNTLWMAFILQTDSMKLYLGGDGGYDAQFAAIGEKFGGFDLAILENGQYNQAWHAIHLLPNETLQAAIDLTAKRMMPVHSSKFKLSVHPWDEPLKMIVELNDKGNHIPLVTPEIGKVVYLNDTTQVFDKWWEKVN